MEQFSPLSGLIGGGMIGLSAALLFAGIGRVAGISGILSSALQKGCRWRLVFLVCMGLGGGGYILFAGEFPIDVILPNYLLLGVAGLLVGFGTRLGGGCTSGHGVCGLSRLSYRSFVAVLVFMLSAGVVVYLARHVI